MQEGVRWFHTGGIFAALSDSTAEVALEATAAARRAGTIVSYDLNYRPSLWTRRGGQPAATDVNRRVACNVDVMLGNERTSLTAWDSRSLESITSSRNWTHPSSRP